MSKLLSVEKEMLSKTRKGVELTNQNVYVTSEVVNFQQFINRNNPEGSPEIGSRRGYEKAIISEGQIVNVVGEKYGHLPNENFFMPIEIQLLDLGINFIKRSINKDNRAFAVDFIMDDPNYVINIKNPAGHTDDTIVPMMRFINAYDGSSSKIGYFGMFRDVCTNGLHIGTKQIGFKLKSRSDIEEIVLPEIDQLIEKFTSNEYYEISRKFEILAERPITDLSEFVKVTAEQTGVFQYIKSENNPVAGLKALYVMETIEREANLLGTKPNLWLGYNAFNSIIHDKFNKTFEMVKKLDEKVFDFILQMN